MPIVLVLCAQAQEEKKAPEKLPEGWAIIANLNPMVPILSVYRSALLGYPLDTTQLAFAALWALGLSVFAITVFVRFEGKMARYL